MADKLQIVLDLDETLINFIQLLKWERLAEKEQNKYKILKSDNEGVFIVRPYVGELLDFVFNNCIVSIWTWADKDYALEVANLLTNNKPEMFANIWSGKDADLALKIYKNSKDLQYLWCYLDNKNMKPCNTILVDDLDNNTKNDTNKHNTIQVPAFDLFSEKDDIYKDVSKDKALLNVIEIIKNVLQNPTFCKNDLISPFTSLQKVLSTHNGGRRRQLTLKHKRKRDIMGSRAHPDKN
jgi:hypothetical protein